MSKSNKYVQLVQPRLEEIKGWRLAGMKNKAIAEQLGVSLSLLDKGKLTYPELKEALETPPNLSVEQLRNKEQQARRNHEKYYASTGSFIRRHATEGELITLADLLFEQVKVSERKNILEHLFEQLPPEEQHAFLDKANEQKEQ